MHKKVLVIIFFTFLLIGALTIQGKERKFSRKQEAKKITENRSYVVDTEKSVIYWVGRKTFSKHTGTIDIKEGILNTNERQIVEGEFLINMESIQNKDIEDPELKKKLMIQLRSKGFFNVANFPVTTFRLFSAIKMEDKNQYLISGDLEIKGIVKKINFPAEITFAPQQLLAKANFTIDRKMWNIQFGSGNFFDNLGDTMINDDIELTLNIRAKAQELAVIE